MSLKREVNLTKQPALIPLFGGMDKRPRALDQDAITIGRARGCDLALDAPEVSTLHCLLYRNADGFWIRDCGSRTGTRINGSPPRHQPLNDGDVLQVGPFSFRVAIPKCVKIGPGTVDAAALERSQESRRKVLRLAWHMRSRLQKKENEEIMNQKEQLAAERAETSDLLEKQRLVLNQAETTLREQRAELGSMMVELRELQTSIKKQQGADVPALLEENQELRRKLAEYESFQQAIEATNGDASVDAEKLQAENDLFRRLLAEKDGIVEELRKQAEELKHAFEAPRPLAPAGNVDLETYEAELNEYRRELENDRVALDKEIEQVRVRNDELDEATREMEMAMSKERADLARERIRLDRMREEVRAEAERLQREAAARESVASVAKLRGEMLRSPAAQR